MTSPTRARWTSLAVLAPVTAAAVAGTAAWAASHDPRGTEEPAQATAAVQAVTLDADTRADGERLERRIERVRARTAAVRERTAELRTQARQVRQQAATSGRVTSSVGSGSASGSSPASGSGGGVSRPAAPAPAPAPAAPPPAHTSTGASGG